MNFQGGYMKRLLAVFLAVVLAASVGVTSVVHVQAALTYDQKQERAANRKYVTWTQNVAKKITNATPSKKLTVSTAIYTSFPSYVIEALDKRPDVTLVVNWTSNDGQELTFTIPAGTDVMKVLDANGFAGFLYLQGLFGPKGNTKEAKKLRTKDKTPPVGAGISDQNRALAEQLEEQAVVIYMQAGLSQEDAEEAAAAALPSLLEQAGVPKTVIAALTNEAAVTAPTAATPAAPAPAGNTSGLTAAQKQAFAEQLAQQAYAQFIGAGMSSEEAFAATQQALPGLLQQAGLL